MTIELNEIFIKDAFFENVLNLGHNKNDELDVKTNLDDFPLEHRNDDSNIKFIDVFDVNPK